MLGLAITRVVAQRDSEARLYAVVPSLAFRKMISQTASPTRYCRALSRRRSRIMCFV